MYEQQIHDLVFGLPLYLYSILQWLLDRLLSPTPPPPNAKVGRRKVAVIGAGLTGVSAASHCVGHGFDVVIFEAGDRDSVGGIWAVSTERRSISGTDDDIESEQYVRPPDQQYHVPLPSKSTMVQELSKAK